MAKATLALNEVHKPSVSFNEIEGDDALASTIFNGKIYVTKDFLREMKFNLATDVLDVSITKRTVA